MKRIEQAVYVSINRRVNAVGQIILKGIIKQQYWTVQRYPSGKWAVILLGDSSDIPANWHSLPSMTVDSWNKFLASTNNQKLINLYHLDGYDN